MSLALVHKLRQCIGESCFRESNVKSRSKGTYRHLTKVGAKKDAVLFYNILQAKDYRLDTRLSKACKDDVKDLCSHVCDAAPGQVCGGSVLHCLQVGVWLRERWIQTLALCRITVVPAQHVAPQCQKEG